MVSHQLTSRAGSQTSRISLNPSACYSFEGFIFTSTQATGITSCCLSFYYFSFQAQIRLLTLLSRAGVASSTTYSCAGFRCSISPTSFAYPRQFCPCRPLNFSFGLRHRYFAPFVAVAAAVASAAGKEKSLLGREVAKSSKPSYGSLVTFHAFVKLLVSCCSLTRFFATSKNYAYCLESIHSFGTVQDESNYCHCPITMDSKLNPFRQVVD